MTRSPPSASTTRTTSRPRSWSSTDSSASPRPNANLRDCRANFACLDYQTNIQIGDDDPKVYVARFRSERGDEAYSKACAENALPEGFENMEYPDFLVARERLMAAMIREAFGRL